VSVTQHILQQPIFEPVEVSISTQTPTTGPKIVSELTQGICSLSSIVDQQLEKQASGQDSTQTYKTWIKTDPTNTLPN